MPVPAAEDQPQSAGDTTPDEFVGGGVFASLPAASGLDGNLTAS